MAKHQALWANNVKQPSLPPHLYEFLNVSASYLEVSMDSLNKGGSGWQGNANVAKQSNQKVNYVMAYPYY